ncbi:hypothetical protein IW249_003739 [Micromonospora vinacea]|uniref:Integral membrane protein n=1 Tax=Micromonospora vinacea TaxID=709878 RepID=A0ABS0K3W5_9ACTN|nr:hypothetical protein [Micromonospora vinacea]MBG6103325.1 hypothetical protein [Micromonospora vinacea]WTA69574.1 hypothetical protein OHB51_10640 [Micromonospora sp. NBC_00855]
MSGPDDSGDAVELRVHGVSGASAAQVLDLQQTGQVAGDRSGGFYRPRPRCSDTTGVRGVTLEAYRWGDLPSGTVARTLAVVFLLPFMLVNVAIWMRPANPGSEAAVKSLCRVLALTLTVLYVLAIAGVAVDLVGWGCLASPDCLAGRSWLSWLGGRPTGQRLAVLALVPAAAIGLIWRVSCRPGRTFEAFRAPDEDGSASRLGTIGQWDAEPLVGRLRAIHVAAAFATLDLVLLLARGASDASAGTIALTAITGVILAGCVGVLCTPPLIDRDPGDQRLDRVTRTLRTTSVILTVAVVAYVSTSSQPWTQEHGLPGYDATLAGLFVAQTALLAALGVVLLWHRRRERDATPLFGLGALVVAATGISMAVAYSAELVYRVADFLDRDVPTGDGIASGPPRAYTWAIYGFFRALLITVVVSGLVVLISRRSRRRAAAAIVARDFPDPPAEAGPRLRQVRDAIARARFTEKLVPLAVLYGCLTGLGTATTTIGLLGQVPSDVIERNVRLPADAVTFGIAFGSWVIAAIILGLIIGGIFAYRTEPYRRHIGVLWDLGTFWPRAAHPFAPPCYSERAVPELTRRITYLVERGDAVLLTGHSHGSVLLAATVLQLPQQVGDRVALLTHGSPLRRLYARLFPAYVNDAALREIGRRVDWRWVNLWRDTDPIGGWVFSPRPASATSGDPAAAVDRRQRDPRDVVTPPGDSVAPPIHGHWPGESDEPFTEAVRELVQRLGRRGGPTGTTG